MNYWLVRAKWSGDDKTTQFIQNDEWINGYDDKYLDIVNRVEEGDILLLADNSLVYYYAKCEENAQDGQNIVVDKWKKFDKPITFPAKGAYIKTIVKINNIELIEKSKLAIEELKAKESILIKSIGLKNFTLFKNHRLMFSSGLNVFIGENGTGKTQLLKLIYSVLKSNNETYETIDYEYSSSYLLGAKIEENIKLILKVEYLENLIDKEYLYDEKIEEPKSKISLDLQKYIIDFILFQMIENDYNGEVYMKNSLFIPAKEILSFYTGFRSIYNQTSFDATFDDLANHLGRLVPKNRVLENFEEKILKDLEEILGGKIILEQDRFYLLEDDGNKREITLVAEGARKLGTIFHLLANGTIEKGSVIFWDEPESNLNPKFIRYVAKMLLELEKAGIQIFIATHSLFLVNEIEILREKENNIEYFSFGFDKEQALRVSQSSKLEELKDLVLLDEEIAQGDRFMSRRR